MWYKYDEIELDCVFQQKRHAGVRVACVPRLLIRGVGRLSTFLKYSVRGLKTVRFETYGKKNSKCFVVPTIGRKDGNQKKYFFYENHPQT